MGFLHKISDFSCRCSDQGKENRSSRKGQGSARDGGGGGGETETERETETHRERNNMFGFFAQDIRFLQCKTHLKIVKRSHLRNASSS